MTTDNKRFTKEQEERFVKGFLELALDEEEARVYAGMSVDTFLSFIGSKIDEKPEWYNDLKDKKLRCYVMGKLARRNANK